MPAYSTPICKGPEFWILKRLFDRNRQRLVHFVTRARSNVASYEDPPDKIVRRGKASQYGPKLNLMALFEARTTAYEQSVIELCGCCKIVSFLWLALDLKTEMNTMIYQIIMSKSKKRPDDLLRPEPFKPWTAELII